MPTSMLQCAVYVASASPACGFGRPDVLLSVYAVNNSDLETWLHFRVLQIAGGKLSEASRSFLQAEVPNPPRSCDPSDRLDDDHMTAEVHRRCGGSYPWSRIMAGCTILISMASLTFLFNQLSSLASTVTLSLVILWCSCVQSVPDLGLGRLGSCPGASTKKGLHKSTFFISIWLCHTVYVIGAYLSTFASFILITRLY